MTESQLRSVLIESLREIGVDDVNDTVANDLAPVVFKKLMSLPRAKRREVVVQTDSIVVQPSPVVEPLRRPTFEPQATHGLCGVTWHSAGCQCGNRVGFTEIVVGGKSSE